MTLEHHDLAHEFPEFKDNIHRLKTANAHFARLFTEYQDVDKAIYRAETGIEPTGEWNLEDQKKSRVLLKDELYQLLQADKAAAAV